MTTYSTPLTTTAIDMLICLRAVRENFHTVPTNVSPTPALHMSTTSCLLDQYITLRTMIHIPLALQGPFPQKLLLFVRVTVKSPRLACETFVFHVVAASARQQETRGAIETFRIILIFGDLVNLWAAGRRAMSVLFGVLKKV